jgi:hypothetical protein
MPIAKTARGVIDGHRHCYIITLEFIFGNIMSSAGGWV